MKKGKRKKVEKKCEHDALEHLGNDYYECMFCKKIFDKNRMKYSPHIKNRPWENDVSIATVLAQASENESSD
jgi:hypothetical protein